MTIQCVVRHIYGGIHESATTEKKNSYCVFFLLQIFFPYTKFSFYF